MAARLLTSRRLTVLRYGPTSHITMPELLHASSQALALSQDWVVVDTLAVVDELLESKAFLAVLAYVLERPHKDKLALSELPQSALEWDLKALSRQNCFAHIGAGLTRVT